LAAFSVSNIKNDSKRNVVIIGIGLLLIIAFSQYGYPREYTNKEEGFYSTNEATTTVQDEYMPVWVKEKPTQRVEQKIEIVEGQAEINNIFYNNKQIKFNISSDKDVSVRINTIYWPGWIVFIDNKETKISYNNPKGVMDVMISKGNHQVRAEFGETTLRIVSDLVSALSFCILVFISFYYKNQRLKIKMQTQVQK